MKFGGTSVEDADAFARVAAIVRAPLGGENSPVVVVVSAMSRVTDALLESVRLAAETRSADSALPTLDHHLQRHADVARALLTTTQGAEFARLLEQSRGELIELLRQVAAGEMPVPVLRDVIVSYGERLSATLLAGTLDAAGVPARYVDARRCVITDDEHGRAAPLVEQTNARTRAHLAPLLAERVVPVLGGFIGATVSGATTTLGRGGSDYTAALVGAALGAREVQIWTDVTGVMTADPRVVANARTIARLSYAEAAELAYFGAKVLHPKTIQPAIAANIPVRVCNSRAPHEEGTIVCGEREFSPLAVKALAHKKGITVLQITAARMLGAYGFLRAIFEIFERHRTSVDIVTTSEVSVSLSIDDTRALPAIIQDLETLGAVDVEHGRAVVCVVGEGLRDTPGVAAHVFAHVSDINISLISQGSSNVNLTFVVDEARAAEAVARLHAAFFGHPPAVA
ncbi:MAG TPA: lysine-sensitive aspartokinase 3 [Pyrinomonadaceae bacterium]|jgi:aspartate kinase|nr:lysine-sensitive aspartokinase 3 [Pyrinomonadaceae bacterium]